VAVVADIASVKSKWAAAQAEIDAFASPRWALDLSSKAAIFAQTAIGAAGMPNMGVAGGQSGWAYNPEFLTDVDTGMPYFRFSSEPTNNNQRLIDFRYLMPVGFQGSEVWDRQCIYVEGDIAAGFNPAAGGMKLSGQGNDYQTPAAAEMMMLPMEFGNPNTSVSPVTMPLQTYWYSAESGAGFGKVEQTGKSLMVGRWHCIETHKKLNTPGVADGIAEVWLDDVLVWSRNNYLFRNQASTFFQTSNVKFYAGGMAMPNGLFHCRVAHVDVSTTGRLGVPADLPVYVPPPPPPPPVGDPTWRVGKTKDVFFAIPNTGSMNGLTTQAGVITAWGGVARYGTQLVSPAQGGHSDGRENKTLGNELYANVPPWALLHPGSSVFTPDNTAYYADGLPAPRHGYYTLFGVKSRNRVFMFSAPAANLAPISAKTVDAFDMVSRTWDAAGTHPSFPLAIPYQVATLAQHPTTEDVYFCCGSNRARWNAASDTWTTLPGGAQWQFHPSIIDAQRNRWVYCENATLKFMDLTTNAFTSLAITGGASAGDYSGFCHDTGNDRYLLLAGTTVWSINPSTGASVALTTTTAAVNGCNGRFHFMPELRGVAYLPSFTSDILFLPTQ
jgi:hypothetical protein